MDTQSRPKLVRDPGELLDEATQCLVERIESVLPDSGELPKNAALDELLLVREAVEEILGGTLAPQACERLGRLRLDARLVQALRREVVSEERSDDPSIVVQLVRVLDIVLDSILPTDPTDLRARLGEPDAFELLVEVAHDLRSPLTSILFLSETLRVGHSGEINEVQRSQLGLIYSAALGLASVSSDMVDLARGGRGLADADIEPYSVSEVFRGVERMASPMAEEKGVELRVEPPGYDRALGHPVALGRALLNLVTNSLKFTDQGYVEMGAVRSSRSTMEFYVRDTGRGISKEAQKALFQPFKKAEQRQGHFFSGSGLGLTIVRRLVRSMGSELRLETRPNWGTRFYFTLHAPIPSDGDDRDTVS